MMTQQNNLELLRLGNPKPIYPVRDDQIQNYVNPKD